MKKPILYIIIPCYNEEKVLPVTSPLFLAQLQKLIDAEKISAESKILFVNDGSRDDTWDIITRLAKENPSVSGICLSRNRGHQNALLAGLMDARDKCDVTISIDCDGQDDMNAMEAMIDAYAAGYEIVYGVRSKRDTDTLFKRFSAESFYRLMQAMGAEVVYNHSDYRLLSARVLQEFSAFHEVNLFLRGLMPLVGFKSTIVYYERHERMAGESHYPLSKMLSFAFDGITSLSVRPLSLITCLGLVVSIISFLVMLYVIYLHLSGDTVSGWASIVCGMCAIGGIQLICLGVIGQYIGKIYLETKHRPRYIISDRTDENSSE